MTSRRALDAAVRACAAAGLRFPGGRAARPLPAGGSGPGSGAGGESRGDRSAAAAGACGAAGGPRRAARSFPGGGGGALRLSRERRRPERLAGLRGGPRWAGPGGGAMWIGRSSFTSLVVGVFVVYVVHTRWVMYGIVYTRPCSGDGNCIQPYLARRPKLQVSAGPPHLSSDLRAGRGP